jgi:hypothetical protein
LKKQQKPEKWLPKIHEIDQNREKSTENSKSTPAKQALWKAHLNLEIPTNDSFNGLFNMHAPCEYREGCCKFVRS